MLRLLGATIAVGLFLFGLTAIVASTQGSPQTQAVIPATPTPEPPPATATPIPATPTPTPMATVTVGKGDGYCHTDPCFYYLARWEWFIDSNPLAGSVDTYWRAPGGDFLGLLDFRSLPQMSQAGGDAEGYGFFVYDSPRDICTLGCKYEGSPLATDIDAPLIAGKLSLETSLGLSSGSLEKTTLRDVLVELITEEADITGLDKWLPIMPKSDGTVELLLGGHSVIYSDVFSPESHPWVFQLLYEQWKQERTAVEVGRAPPGAHLKTLTVYSEKYHLTPAEILDIWGEPFVQALPHDTTITEDWNCSNSDSPDCDLDWTELTIDYDIGATANKLEDTGSLLFNGALRAETTLSTDDHFSQADVQFEHNNAEHGGLATRFAAAAETFYRGTGHHAFSAGAGGDDYIYKVVAGARSKLAEQGHSYATSPVTVTMNMESDGSSHTFDSDGTILNVSDGSIPTNKFVGLASKTRIGSQNHKWDDFIGEDLPVSATRRIFFFLQDEPTPQALPLAA